MTTDDFLLDQVERSQRHQKSRRRDSRSRRRHLYLLGGIATVVLVVLGGPSLLSHSSIGRSLAIRTLADYGLEGEVESIRMGWITPLRVTRLSVGGAAGSQVMIEQLDVDMTATDFISSSGEEPSQIAVRGLEVVCTMTDGRCSLEDDLQPLIAASGDEGSTTSSLKLQDISVVVTDTPTGDVWQIAQSNADVNMTADRLEATFAGVVTEPGGSGGSLQGSIELSSVQLSSVELGNKALSNPAHAATAATQSNATQWRLDIRSESLPLSVVSLIRRRFPNAATSIPQNIQGDATGAVLVVGTPGGAIEATIGDLEVRNLTASEQGSRAWNNNLATLDGKLILFENRVIGKKLRATTDFAAATIDGAFSRTFSLVGANDNPLRWLEAIDGTATAEIDLAAFDQALPGILPLRNEAQLVSGRVVGRVDSAPSAGIQRSQLAVRSDAIRARSLGRIVVIDPIELVATVSSDHGQVKAERFEWKSAFGSAVGQGDLRSGNADVEIDFGRLTSMLRPIVHISETSLAGAARGTIQWNASRDNVWRLSGRGNASDLLITLPGGQSLKRPTLRGEIEAEGRWGGQSLDELTRADVTLASNGWDLHAELVQAVRRPSLALPMPVRIRGTGRMETVAETLGPWLPAELHNVSGGFSISARGEVSTATQRLTSAALELTQPKAAYGSRFFTQPRIKVHFDGDYVLPSGDFDARSLTIAGDAFSVAAQGESSSEIVDLEVKWRAKLDRIQGSVQKRLASRPAPTVQQVGYRPGDQIETEEWAVMGDCEGAFVFTKRGGLLEIETHATGQDIAVIQPPKASAGFQTVGPRARAPGNQPASSDSSSRVVWYEPNLKIDGTVGYNATTGGVVANAMQVAGDWFATTLSGSVLWNQTTGDVRLQGPARLKMNEVAKRLSSLAGLNIRAEGIQTTPLDIRAVKNSDGNVAINIVGNLGWEMGEVAGVIFGPASIPVRLTETSVDISPSRIPVGQGSLNLAGQVHYRPGPLWMKLERGVVAESIELTPEMTNRWLKYLAPLAADSTNIYGTMGAEIDEAVVVFDQPDQSRVTGRLNIGGAQMTPGLMANQIINGIGQLKSIATALSAQPVTTPTQTLISMPAQTVNYTVNQGVVTHDRLFFDIDRAQVVTSGRVSMDGRLDMVAQVRLDERWLGNDLKGLAGQPVTLPIEGTLSRPSLNSSGVREVVKQLGAQAVQSTAENYLQKQFNRVLDKTFGR